MSITDETAALHLKKYLDDLIGVPLNEWNYFRQHIQFLNLQKDQFFFRQGERPSDLGFTVFGLIVNYYTDSKGEEYVKKFSIAGAPIACYGSLIGRKEANYSAKALENTLLITIKYHILQECYDRHPCWQKLGRLNAERLYLEKEHREETFLTADAKQRYGDFCQHFPDLEDKVPQYLIASYIGITPVSLSRLKHKR